MRTLSDTGNSLSSQTQPDGDYQTLLNVARWHRRHHRRSGAPSAREGEAPSFTISGPSQSHRILLPASIADFERIAPQLQARVAACFRQTWVAGRAWIATRRSDGASDQVIRGMST